jgi:prepilin-type N-terminal cleavage/methylation domain-containing protein
MKSLMAKKANAFTLIEILVVILIIGLLFVFLVPKISNATDKAREVGVKTTFHSYETAFESVMKEQSGLGENAVTSDAKLVEYINSYLDPALQLTKEADTTTAYAETGVNVHIAAKKDPWNNEYIFKSSLSDGTKTSNSNDGVVAIYTRGKDSVSSTKLGSIADVSTASESLGYSKAGDDYALICAYVDGIEYTATVGFSTDIAAK